MSLDIFFYVLIFFISTILTRNILTSMTRSRLRLPPSPTSLPIIGHLHLLNHTPHQTFHKLATRYGPLIHLRLGTVPCIIASSSNMAKEILMSNELIFASRPITIATHILTYNSSGFAFHPYGPFWKRVKKIVMSRFLDSRNLARLQPIRNNEILNFLTLVLDKSNKDEMVNVSEEVSRLSNNVVTRMMLGVRCSGEDEQAKKVQNVVRDVTRILGEFNLSDFIKILNNFDLQGISKRSKDIHSRYDTLLEGIMKEREKVRNESKENNKTCEGAKDFLDVLMDISEDEDADVKLTRDNIKACMFDFITAGTDTSGIVIEWALSELLNHPSKLEKAREEIDLVVGKNRLIQESDVTHLIYIQSIFKETLRLHPPIPVTERKSSQECKIGGYDVPTNTTLFVNVWSIGRDPKHWDEPLEFRPERFMQGPNIIDVRGQHFDLLPFGSGRRGCPGVSLAAQFIPAVLGLLVQCFDWKVPGHENKHLSTSIDMSERPGFTLPKANPLKLVPSARLNKFPLA